MALSPERLIAQVHEAARAYRRLGGPGREHMRALWVALCEDPARIKGVNGAHVSFMVPSLVTDGILCHEVKPVRHPYAVGAIDGSQIYPDHHEGVPFFLVHTAALLFNYGLVGAESSFAYTTNSEVFCLQDLDNAQSLESPAAFVDRKRAEAELHAGQVLADGQPRPFPPLFVLLFDGSLIFWHLTSRAVERDPFFRSYCTILEGYARQSLVTAWYTSLPQGRDLVNLVRAAFGDEVGEAYKTVVDADLLGGQFGGWLQPNHRTAAFFSGAEIAAHYPAMVRPAFFYLNTGDEVARVEIPAWIAENPILCDQIAGVLLDQCTKGQGYPISLAEAHEQAVVRSADRELFFSCARQALEDGGHGTAISRKSLNKRRAGF